MKNLSPPPPLAGGRYVLSEPLGEGGMAVVWRGFDNTLEIPCAIKQLNRNFTRSANQRSRFMSEARTMARLRHPAIVAVQDLGEEDGCPYIVMEILSGSVAQLVERSGPMPPRLASGIIIPIIDALGFAHKSDVIHRDVKPENILFNEAGDFKLTDFGIARLHRPERSLTRTGVTMGTWGFMAPEQRKDSHHVDARADLYAVGATLFMMLVGEHPVDLFTADRDETILADVPDPLRAFIQKSTSYRPEDRFQTAAEMSDALTEIHAGLPKDEAPYSLDIKPEPSGSDEPPEPDAAAPADSSTPAPSDAAPNGFTQGDFFQEIEDPESQDGYFDDLDEAPPKKRRGGLIVGLLAAAGLLAAGLWFALRGPADVEPAPPTPAVNVPRPEPPPTPVAPEPEPEPEPEDTAPPEDTAAPEEEPEQEQGQEQKPTPPAPTTSAPVTGKILVSGDASSVRFQSFSGTLYQPGELPVGTYVILASFDGEPFPSGRVTLTAGQQISVKCSSVFGTCTVQ